jgi:serine/threonine protein kinase
MGRGFESRLPLQGQAHTPGLSFASCVRSQDGHFHCRCEAMYESRKSGCGDKLAASPLVLQTHPAIACRWPIREGRYAVQALNGQQLGDFIIESELGRGSMGVVYLARHAQQGGHFALKVLLDALVSDQSFITRFTREARIIASLTHPNIVRVYGAGRQGQHLYFVMEYFRGVTAGRMLKERERLPVGQAIEIAAQAADALAYAHSHGKLVHRDIKPENLLVDRWCRVKVLDFGLARVAGLQSITRVGTVVGSLYYVSPEQLLGR